VFGCVARLVVPRRSILARAPAPLAVVLLHGGFWLVERERPGPVAGLPGGGPDEVPDRDAATDPNAFAGPTDGSPLRPSADRGDRQSGDRAGPGSRNGESAGDEHVVQR